MPAADDLAAEADLVAASPVPMPDGSRLPVPTGLRELARKRARFVLRRGVLVVVDYAATAAELVERGQDGWLRTYRAHERGASPLDAPGEQDITVDVPLEYLVHAAGRAGLSLELECTQAEWLRDLGIDDLVAEARAQWDARGARRRPRGVPAPQPGHRGGGARSIPPVSAPTGCSCSAPPDAA